MPVCFPVYPHHKDQVMLELPLRQTLQIHKNMGQAQKEGRGKEAGFGNGVMPCIPSQIWWRNERA